MCISPCTFQGAKYNLSVKLHFMSTRDVLYLIMFDEDYIIPIAEKEILNLSSYVVE